MMLNAQNDMWIGLNDVNWEMRFLWTDGKGVRYTNWAKGYPVSFPDSRSSYGSEASAPSLLYLHNYLPNISISSLSLIKHACYLLLVLLKTISISIL